MSPAIRLSNLQRLEAESIHIFREVMAEAERPVMLYLPGKDSAVMLRLARKAFHPALPPFPLLHVDTTWKFRDRYGFRDRTVRELGMTLHVWRNPPAQAQGIHPFDHGSRLHTDLWKTQGLKQALARYGFDAAFGGARRDEEKSRAKEHIFSFRNGQRRWDPKQQRPGLWHLYNGRKAPGESMRVFPLSNWTELDIWQYIGLEQIPVVPLYFAAERPVVERDGARIMVDDERMRLRPGEVPVRKKVRFRSLGCYPLPAAVGSDAETVPIDRRAAALARQRAARAPDRPRPGCVHGTEEARGLLLMTGAPSSPDTDAGQAQYDRRTLLRFITCGSVDDGKSTLIGRLLYESEMLPDDQLAAMASDSRRWGMHGKELDFALLVDGLAAEREQGITIDVAYRCFSTANRKYIVADTPGHEQYTRNMVTGASTAGLAVILVDARKGVLTQTRRHSFLVRLLGIRQAVLAVNKMDLVDHDETVFRRIEDDYDRFADRIGLARVSSTPLSALRGDNVVGPSLRMPWYQGPTLMQVLEQRAPQDDLLQVQPMRLPVQWVNRSSPGFRGYSGLLCSGCLKPGDPVRVLPSGQAARVARLVGLRGDLPVAVAGESVTLTLDSEIDVSRGDVLVAAHAPAEVADQFECTVIWMNEVPMLAGRAYLLKLATCTVNATITEPKYKLNVHTLEHLATKTLALNEIGVCNLSLDQALAFEPHAVLPERGGFILIDRASQQTVGAGMLHFALRRAHNVHLQHLDIDRTARAALMGQRPLLLWFTGLSGAGKSAIASLVARQLHALGRHTYVLDGDNVRHGLCRHHQAHHLGHAADVLHPVGIGEAQVADAGLIVIASFVSPFRAERAMAQALFPDGRFVEVHVHAPLDVAEARGPKGLYAKARRGELPHFTGIDSPYEAPEQPEILLDTTRMSPAEAADPVLAYMRATQESRP